MRSFEAIHNNFSHRPLRAFAALALTTMLVSSQTASAAYTLDPSHSTIGFKVSHLMISDVTGSFKKAEATIDFDEASNSLKGVEATVDVTSVDTRDAKRDEHLTSPDFFDAKKFPSISFRSTEKASLKPGKSQKLKGELTIRGVAKPVVLSLTYKGSVVDPWGNKRVGFVAETKVDRRDFGMTWNKALDKGGVVVGNEVRISIDGEAIFKGETAKN